MTSPYIGEIKMVGFNFAARGYAFCNGQLLSIAQNTALFSLLGTTYGGNGTVTFGLPDMRGRFPMHWGQGPGLSNRTPGEVAGTESVTLVTSNMPAHNHSVQATSSGGDTATPSSGALLAGSTARDNIYLSSGSANTNLSATSIAGSSLPISIMPPYLVVTFLIATQGIFPSRN